MEPVKLFSRTLAHLRTVTTLIYGALVGFGLWAGGFPVLYGIFLGASLFFLLTVED